MRLARLHVVNFRGLRDLTMSFDDVTFLVGANSTGKSTVLHALAWFFGGGPPTMEDISGHQPGEQITVGVTFTHFDDSDRDVYRSSVDGDQRTLWRTSSTEDGEKLTGKGRAAPALSVIRDQVAALAQRSAYGRLLHARPELRLPR